MNPPRLVVIALRASLGMTFSLLLLLQVMSLPGQFAHMAREDPDMAYLRWPLTAFSILELVCVQVVIVCTWKLLSMVVDRRIFSSAAFAWVDGILVAIAAAWTMLFGFAFFVALNATDPGIPLILLLILVSGAVLELLMVVMRALLRQAAALRADMESVI